MKPQGEQKMVSVSDLRESPTNPRKTYGDLAELVASVKRHGILQPLVARATDDGLELVFGHRRYRAAKEAGLKQVPVIVRDLPPEQVLEEQLVENVQREDIHPMEEAEAYERLRAEFGYSVDEIADRVGKTRSSVYARMKLCDLSPAARKAFYRGDLDPSRALLIARLKGENTQVRALEIITKKDRRGDMMSFRAAAEFVQSRFGKVKREDGEKEDTPVRKVKGIDDDTIARQWAERQAMKAMVEIIERRADFDAGDLRVILHALIELVPVENVLERRGIERPEHLATAITNKLSRPEMRALLFEVAVTPWMGDSSAGFTPQIKALAKNYKLNLRELQGEGAYKLEQESKKAAAESLFAKVQK